MHVHAGMRALTAVAAIGFACVGVGALPPAQAEGRTHTFVLTQQPPALHPVDADMPGASVADAVLYESVITGDHGENGLLTGFLITADVPDAETGDVDADRLGQLSFDLGGGNMLAVIGESTYRGEAVEMTPSAPQLRAVVGGTGTFIGSRGQVATTRNGDGTYRHEFTLLDD
ncbi:hypothetical protein TUM20985_53550 [Mycobacterium antarcticum]|uniref:hypothetical protein n=1 Tax=unclassified Mycolicibacterium TaxID=2636767 RepID=UPI0023933CE4|nr:MULTISPECIES: hypothetical protein [unclassified Mycolicibacterium]BDX34808.1 hypothetical protein TUM20985_53550 [Mycolicibacterium sp. TUM20985]GLP78009.1 hypothetical protein TUM20983_51190 [Mycolicibacterium sp. TUM20983]GLP81082.1 hypothetical protein TUM20984_25020 [Mycolicibacterium sp. TUM20984]